jgi:hypothetical protein
MGDEDMDVPYRVDDEAHVLWIRVCDDYVSLPQKVIRAYAAIVDMFPPHLVPWSYIYKTDDDQLTTPHFFRYLAWTLATQIKKYPVHYGGQRVCITERVQSTYHLLHPELNQRPESLWMHPTVYCSGRFYFLSQVAVRALVTDINRVQRIQNEVFEDYAIGFHLPELYKHTLLPFHTPSHFHDMDTDDA